VGARVSSSRDTCEAGRVRAVLKRLSAHWRNRLRRQLFTWFGAGSFLILPSWGANTLFLCSLRQPTSSSTQVLCYLSMSSKEPT